MQFVASYDFPYWSHGKIAHQLDEDFSQPPFSSSSAYDLLRRLLLNLRLLSVLSHHILKDSSLFDLLFFNSSDLLQQEYKTKLQTRLRPPVTTINT
ncbi:hypothetical protein LWI29_026911 [Acer saccharum]|uniref:Uncharacterized protein n=1 Tax=Acer saccharum TaxID=4024 RepID=A0AA39T6Q9_ACESA|nr:hypothetical protein LWI29_026911 [Acer saccharum]